MYQGDDKEGEDNDKMVDEMMENLDSFVLEPAPQVINLIDFWNRITHSLLS